MKSRLARLALAFGLGVTLTACDQARSPFSRPEAPGVEAASPMPTNPLAAPILDTGKIGSVVVNVKGAGATAAEAVDEAMRMALKQVNGTTMAMNFEQSKFTLSLARGKNAEALRGNAFAEHVAQSSGGAITGFKVNSLEGPDDHGLYKADVEATVAKFTPSVGEDKKLKIVVAPLRHDVVSFPVGGRSVPAEQVAENLRQQVIAALTRSGRFIVLDRDVGHEVAQELDLISSGQAPRAEFGKLGQATSADVIWIGKITSFAYNRNARKLQTSDRELVSHSGGWAVSQKLVNVSTRQIMLSDAIRGEAPRMAATTLNTGVDGAQVSDGMQNDIASRIVSAIVSRTFPVTVISHESGTVVLSQGGNAVREGGRYKLVNMGKEMFDPQTDQSLGRVESDCCEVVIERVMPTMAQGRLEKVQMSLEGLQPGTLQLRGMVTSKSTTTADAGERPAFDAKPVRAAPQRSTGGAAPATATSAVDDKW